MANIEQGAGAATPALTTWSRTGAWYWVFAAGELGPALPLIGLVDSIEFVTMESCLMTPRLDTTNRPAQLYSLGALRLAKRNGAG